MFKTFRFGTELRRFGRTRLQRLAIVAAVCIPLLYGALYLWAFWNPTEHLDRVPVALVNQDTGATKDDSQVHAGRDLADELVAKRNLGWHETSQAEAAQGLEQGKYFAILTIPPRFSEAVVTMGTDHPVQAPLQVTYDDAQGYTARTILSSVMREVRTAAGQAIGQQAVSQLFIGFSNVHSGLIQARDGANQLAEGTTKAREGTAQLADGARQLSDGANTLAQKTGDAANGAHQLHQGTSQAVTGTQQLADGARTAADGSAQLATGASTLASKVHEAETGATVLSSGLEQLASATADLPQKSRQLAEGSAKVADGNRQLATRVTTVTGSVDNTLDDLARVANELCDCDPHKTYLLDGIARAKARTAEVSGQVNALADGAQQVAQGNQAIADQAPTLAGGIQRASTGATTLANGLGQLSTGAETLAQKSGELRDGVRQLSTGAQTLASGSKQLDDGAAQLDTGLGQLRDGATTLATKTGELRDGAITLRDGAVQLDDGEHELATKLGEAADKVPNMSAAERDANAQVMSAPVVLDQSWNHQAQSQGEGFAPYFIGLALYVGAMILWMLLRPLSARSLAAPVTAARVVLSNWLPAVVLGIAQALLLLLVLILGLGMQPQHLAVAVAFTLLVSIAYVTLQQAFNVIFGSAVGRVVTLVVLTMQITSSGGTYPAETSPDFFQALHQTLPMTQVVNGLRSAITGDLNHRFWIAVVYLLVMTVGSLMVSTAAAARKRVWTVSRLHPAISL